jgi:hypothetical protein
VLQYLVQSAVDGFNVCIFAYGQTGSGKTFTIYGSEDNPGLTPRAISELFRIIRRDSNKYSFSLKVISKIEMNKKFRLKIFVTRSSDCTKNFKKISSLQIIGVKQDSACCPMLTSLVLTMQAYMVELYQDTLIDLLLPRNAKHSRLDIKKDSTVMIPMLSL